MVNLPVEKAKEKLAALIRQVATEGELIVLQTPDGLQAALVNLATLPTAVAAFTAKQEAEALLAADAVRVAALADRNRALFPDVSSELDAIRELRSLELQGVS